MKHTLALLVLFALAASGAYAAGPPPKPFQQDKLVIGFWGDPPVDGAIDARYAEVKAAHFNVVLGGMGADTPDKARKQRDACEKQGLKVIFSTYGLPIDKLCNCDTTYGFLVRDHPSVADFAFVRSRIDDIHRLRPTKLPFVNLFPSTASAAELGAAAYGDYLHEFVKAVRPQVLCFDHYPSFAPEADGRAGFCENLDVFRALSFEHDVPFWCFVKAMAYGSSAVPTEAQIRWQVYAALAHGATGILYSCYSTPPEGSGFVGAGIIGPDGTPTERYAQVTHLNAALACLGPALVKLHCADVARVGAGAPSPASLPFTIASKDANDEWLVGVFERDGGGPALLLMNYRDQGNDAVVTLTPGAPGAKLLEVSKSTGNAEALADGDPALDGIQLTLAPGDGRLILVTK